jgi:aconitate hydratase
MSDSFGTRSTLTVGGSTYEIHRLEAFARQYPGAAALPYSLKILLENLLRNETDAASRAAIEALAAWNPTAEPDTEIAFSPARVIHQDFTGVPAVVDLAAMRDAMKRLGGDPRRINPLIPAELVCDHSLQVDTYGTPEAARTNADIEFSRNRERYVFLKWGQKAFTNFLVVPPQTGIIHQVNLENLARVVFVDRGRGMPRAYPDTLVGTDSHTTMINGLGVLGWGVGGIEAEAVMLGQPVSMLIPQVVGFELTGRLAEGATATDLVLTVTQALRKLGVVGKFVEFHGEGLASLTLADRATIANMAPEYGASCGIFPIDEQTLRYLRLTGRGASVPLVEAYAREQGLFGGGRGVRYSADLSLDLGTVEASMAGPKRPQDRVRLGDAGASFTRALKEFKPQPPPRDPARLGDGSVVIAAITSCTNTSNPALLFAAGLLARKAAARGLRSKPWVKTSLAPGSRVATEYLARSGLMADLEKLGFYVVGYGCTTCIGNSGPLRPDVSAAIREGDFVVSSVLSGNRNFEGRVHAEVRTNYLASPPLVVAYAIAGRMDVDLTREPLGTDEAGAPVFLRDVWPTGAEIEAAIHENLDATTFAGAYGDIGAGDEHWRALGAPSTELYAWEADSTYIKHPPYFDGMTLTPAPLQPIAGARVLALLGDSITTDHISPAGSIGKTTPAARYLLERGVKPEDFNAYGARRGNHEVMVRGTFANSRLRNRLAEKEGGFTRHIPSGEATTIFDAAERYRAEGVPLLVIAGKEYGTGSSRDWAAKGTKLLGVRAVLAESFERIHRSNLVGMGVLPLQFRSGETAQTVGFTGDERFDVVGVRELLDGGLAGGREVEIRATASDGTVRSCRATVRIDTPQELQYVRHGGILPYVLRKALA